MIELASQTNIGRRLKNEDSMLALYAAGGLSLVAVADGMGGHAAGKRASGLAVNGLEEHLGEYLRAGTGEDAVQRLQQAIHEVNLEVLTHANTEEGCRGMGTTLTLALLFREQYIAANIGDSRLYHFDGELLTQITHDHSLVSVLVEAGEITQAEANVHPHRNIITRALGTAAQEEADFFQRSWKPGDTLLLCSDGLHGSVPHEQLEELLLPAASPLQPLCDALVEMALANGATDNITVVLARLGGGGPA